MAENAGGNAGDAGSKTPEERLAEKLASMPGNFKDALALAESYENLYAMSAKQKKDYEGLVNQTVELATRYAELEGRAKPAAPASDPLGDQLKSVGLDPEILRAEMKRISRAEATEASQGVLAPWLESSTTERELSKNPLWEKFKASADEFLAAREDVIADAKTMKPSTALKYTFQTWAADYTAKHGKIVESDETKDAKKHAGLSSDGQTRRVVNPDLNKEKDDFKKAWAEGKVGKDELLNKLLEGITH